MNFQLNVFRTVDPESGRQASNLPSVHISIFGFYDDLYSKCWFRRTFSSRYHTCRESSLGFPNFSYRITKMGLD